MSPRLRTTDHVHQNKYHSWTEIFCYGLGKYFTFLKTLIYYSKKRSNIMILQDYFEYIM